MPETKAPLSHSAPPSSADVEFLHRRVSALEQALTEYVERYGLTEKAQEAFRDPKR